MKEVMAIVRINMMNRTKKALSDAGISSMTARDALGRGKDSLTARCSKGPRRDTRRRSPSLGTLSG